MIKKTLLILAGLAVASYSFAADAPAAPAPVAAAITAVPDGNVFLTDKDGKHAVDPVCGMQIVVGDKSPHADQNGKRYYFCSDGCDKAFNAKAAEYIGKMVLPANVLAVSGKKMTVKCAVSGEKVVVDDKTPHQVYKGDDYFFCCNKCPKAFAKDPEKYCIASAKVPHGDGTKVNGMKTPTAKTTK